MKTKTFDKCLNFVLDREGVYSNSPHDPGGETVYGISRIHNPDWEGWDILDNIKIDYGIDSISSTELDKLFKNSPLWPLVKTFYHDKIWKPLQCDEFDLSIALFLFDTGTHMGNRRACKFIQSAINNLCGCDELVVDGIMGPKTKVEVWDSDEYKLVWVAFYERLKFYALESPVDARDRYLTGWANRLVHMETFIKKWS